jgi:hypothetical protein
VEQHNLTYATAPVIQGPVEPIDRCVMTASGEAVEDRADQRAGGWESRTFNGVV